MGYRDDGSRVLVEVALEPGYRLGVEVVGRLVQQEDVRLLEEEAAQGDAALLAARQVVHHLVGGRTAEGVHREIEAAVEIPGVQGVELFLHVPLALEELVHVRVGIAEAFVDLLELGEEVDDLLHPFLHDLADRLPRLEDRFLLEVADRHAGGHARLAGELAIHPGEDLEKARFSRAVHADDADLGAVEIREADILEHLLRPVALAHAVHGVDDLFIVAVCHGDLLDSFWPHYSMEGLSLITCGTVGSAIDRRGGVSPARR